MDCSGVTSSSRFNPCGVSSKTQLKISAGMRPSREYDDERSHHPGRRVEDRQQRARHLHEQPGADQIQSGHADNVSPLQLVEERRLVAHGFAAPAVGGNWSFNF